MAQVANRGIDFCGKMALVKVPGIFTIYCTQGVCNGFSTMLKHESPETAFNIFKLRFPEVSKVILYDNSCKLYQYVLNQEPEFF